jgi:hypothetical protein
MVQRKSEEQPVRVEREAEQAPQVPAGTSEQPQALAPAPGARGETVREPRAAEPFEGSVLRELTDELGLTRPGPGGHRRSDAWLREEVCERLWRDPHVDVGEVSVEVKHGTVVLEGTVPERAMKHRIEDIAAGCRGVYDVENRIRVTSGASPPGAGIV